MLDLACRQAVARAGRGTRRISTVGCRDRSAHFHRGNSACGWRPFRRRSSRRHRLVARGCQAWSALRQDKGQLDGWCRAMSLRECRAKIPRWVDGHDRKIDAGHHHGSLTTGPALRELRVCNRQATRCRRCRAGDEGRDRPASLLSGTIRHQAMRFGCRTAHHGIVRRQPNRA